MGFKLRFRKDKHGNGADLNKELTPVRDQFLLTRHHAKFKDEEALEDFLLEKTTWKNLAKKNKDLGCITVLKEDEDFSYSLYAPKWYVNPESYEIAQQAIKEIREINQ